MDMQACQQDPEFLSSSAAVAMKQVVGTLA